MYILTYSYLSVFDVTDHVYTRTTTMNIDPQVLISHFEPNTTNITIIWTFEPNLDLHSLV